MLKEKIVIARAGDFVGQGDVPSPYVAKTDRSTCCSITQGGKGELGTTQKKKKRGESSLRLGENLLGNTWEGSPSIEERASR